MTHIALSGTVHGLQGRPQKRPTEARKTGNRQTRGSTHVRDRRTSNAEGAGDPLKNEVEAGTSDATKSKQG
jgi:hypothetical protein